jgi:RNA polymerase sigma-32 factor
MKHPLKPKKFKKSQRIVDAEIIDTPPKQDSHTPLKEEEADVIDVESSDIDWSQDLTPYSSPYAETGTSVNEDVDEKNLVVPNALQRYLAEIRKHPLLTPEQEKEVAIKAYEESDSTSRKKLVTANLRLVVKIAMEYRRAYSHLLDLIQEGNAGLVQAVNRFNPYRGVKISTYSAWWIRAYILKFLMDNKSLVRMGTTDAQRKLFFKLRSEAEKLYAQTQKFDAHLLAEKIGVQPQDVIDMQQRLTKHDVSLDTPVAEDNQTRQIDLMISEDEPIENRMAREQSLKLLKRSVSAVEKTLNERDKYILQNRILSETPITLQDIGNMYGITRERARQLESSILEKIKEALSKEGL